VAYGRQPTDDPISRSLTLAGQAVALDNETKHFKIIGTTGTGKSTAIRELLGGALRRGDRAVLADPDAGYLQRFFCEERGDVILNPFDTRSLRWDLYAELREPYDYDQMARCLIPETGAGDQQWNQYARVFFSALLARTHEGGMRDLRELLRLCSSASVDELAILLEGSMAQPYLQSGNERMFASVRTVLVSVLSPLSHIHDQKALEFSIRRFVRDGRGVLFLPYKADQIASLRSLISTWMRLAIFEAMSAAEGDCKLWFVVDELDALGSIEGLKDALARLRKFGGRCVLGFQSIAQVSATYGNHAAQTIVENCGNTLILRCSASEQGGTARFAARLIGEREVIREQISKSRPTGWLRGAQRSESRSTQRSIELAVLPSELEQLPDLVGYLKLASKAEWTLVRCGSRRAHWNSPKAIAANDR
jgi:type IV secretory pathway TraG/TraD family ATPase VirD4